MTLFNIPYLIRKAALPSYQKAGKPVQAWINFMQSNHFENPNQIRQQLGKTDFIGGGRAIFNLGGNKFRLIATIEYQKQMVYIHFFGTHTEYDTVDPHTVDEE